MRTVTALLYLTSLLAASTLAHADGEPDPAFGAGGKYVYAQYIPGAPQGTTRANSMKVLPDGRILVAGSTTFGSGPTAQTDFFVMRLKADGSGLDPAFGSHGGWSSVTCDPPSGATDDSVDDIVLGSGGDFFLIGTSYDQTTYKGSICVAKLDTAGNLIAAFNGNGKLVLSSPSQNWFAVSGLLASSKLIILGDYYHLEGDPLLFRVDAATAAFEGSFLPSNGSLGSSTYVYALAADSGGRIVLTGQHKATNASPHVCFAMRRLADLSADTTFNGGVPLDLPTPVSGVTDSYALCSSVLVQPDGKIVVSGDTRSDTQPSAGTRVFIMRLTDTGALDNSFNSGAPRLTYFEISAPGASNYSSALARQSDGKLLLAGYGAVAAGSNRGQYDFGVIRFKPDGAFDSSFTASTPGSNLATVMLDFGLGNVTTGQEAAYAVSLQSGRILVAGTVDSDTSGTLTAPALARLQVDLIFADTFEN